MSLRPDSEPKSETLTIHVPTVMWHCWHFTLRPHTHIHTHTHTHRTSGLLLSQSFRKTAEDTDCPPSTLPHHCGINAFCRDLWPHDCLSWSLPHCPSLHVCLSLSLSHTHAICVICYILSCLGRVQKALFVLGGACICGYENNIYLHAFTSTMMDIKAGTHITTSGL